MHIIIFSKQTSTSQLTDIFFPSFSLALTGSHLATSNITVDSKNRVPCKFTCKSDLALFAQKCFPTSQWNASSSKQFCCSATATGKSLYRRDDACVFPFYLTFAHSIHTVLSVHSLSSSIHCVINHSGFSMWLLQRIDGKDRTTSRLLHSPPILSTLEQRHYVNTK